MWGIMLSHHKAIFGSYFSVEVYAFSHEALWDKPSLSVRPSRSWRLVAKVPPPARPLFLPKGTGGLRQISGYRTYAAHPRPIFWKTDKEQTSWTSIHKSSGGCHEYSMHETFAGLLRIVGRLRKHASFLFAHLCTVPERHFVCKAKNFALHECRVAKTVQQNPLKCCTHGNFVSLILWCFLLE